MRFTVAALTASIIGMLLAMLVRHWDAAAWACSCIMFNLERLEKKKAQS